MPTFLFCTSLSVELNVIICSFFSVDQLGAIRTRLAVNSSVPTQNLTVSASDQIGRIQRTQVLVTFNGPSCISPPRCPSALFRFSLRTFAAGTVVGTVADSLQAENRQIPLRYTIFGPDQDKFAVNSAT